MREPWNIGNFDQVLDQGLGFCLDYLQVREKLQGGCFEFFTSFVEQFSVNLSNEFSGKTPYHSIELGHAGGSRGSLCPAPRDSLEGHGLEGERVGDSRG